MHVHVTPVLDHPASAAEVTSPVIGTPWFDPGPVVLRLELSLSPDEMAAALFNTEGVTEDDLTADEDVWGCLALEITGQGLGAVQDRAAGIASRAGVVAANPWLSFCRQRVAAALKNASAVTQ